MFSHKQYRISPQALDEATEWFARLASGDASDEDIERHMEWLLDDPSHADAFEMVTASMQDAGTLEGAARAAFASDFKTQESSHSRWWTNWFDAWEWPQIAVATAAAAALLFVVIFPNTVFYDEPSLPHIYKAESDGVRMVKLADGSRVSLFGGSEITVTMSGEAREVGLTKGRAFFDVVSDKARPFYVRTDRHRVKVVGTRFEVVRAAAFARVAVNEGLVAVETMETSSQTVEAPLLIEPGIIARFDETEAAPVLTRTDAASIGAWSEGVLVFRDTHLVDVIARIGDLFPDHTIHLADNSLAEHRFSGTLVVSSAEEMSRQLAEFLGLSVRVEGMAISFSDKP